MQYRSYLKHVNHQGTLLGQMLTKRLSVQYEYGDALPRHCTLPGVVTGFKEPSIFNPARNFYEAKSDIDKSEVFQIIRKMPKGAVLHSHDTAIVSEKFLFENITHRDNLYVCDVGGKLSMRFFDIPDGECDWKLLSDLRRDPSVGQKLDERIRRRMSMFDNETSSVNYSDGNAAWTKFADIFTFITPFLTYRPVYEDHYYQGLQELYDDKVIYLELRSTLPPIYDLDGRSYSPLEVAKIYKNVTDRFVQDHPNFVGVKLIYAPIKTSDPVEFDKFLNVANQLKNCLPDFFAGFDLVGQEDPATPLVVWVDKIRSVDPTMNFFFHAGETNWNGLSVDDNLIDAVLLNSKRIGHGYALTKHPKVLEIVKKKNIAIEICPISNQVLALVKDLRNHPASSMFVDDVPVVVSNDDPGLWGSKALSYDFYEAFMGIMPAHADIRALKQLALNSLIYSSLNEEEKNRAISIWQKQWNEFLADLGPVHDFKQAIMIISKFLRFN
ncbi:adenosine deaminase 2-like [Venturia canescens]|uniref:adenosine deaminase 2-like n=1 Tax=Venturia canescens TaxID=32260 RepID=UPI001C9CDFCE|nr:adenosine deaminase 2-like [Venturia canescens]